MPAPSANSTSANRFETMEDLVAIGLLDQKTLDDAKAKAGIQPTKAPSATDGKKNAHDLKKVVGGKKPAPKPDPNVGVGPGKFVMSSKERVNSLNHGAKMVYSNGKYVGRSLDAGDHVAKAPSLRPASVDKGTGKTLIAGSPSKGDPTRAGSKPNQKPGVPQPRITYADMNHSVRFGKA